eukprot:m.111427 g.111427  ORF g.111427 m.111427 type:complete len:126 (+) comp51820_c1_seq8:1798-2175(+)
MYRFLARLPLRGAGFAVCINKLKGLDQPKDLLDTAADRVVVEADMAKDAFRVDDVRGAQMVPIFLHIATVVDADRAITVRQKGNLHGPETAWPENQLRAMVERDPFALDFRPCLRGVLIHAKCVY